MQTITSGQIEAHLESDIAFALLKADAAATFRAGFYELDLNWELAEPGEKFEFEEENQNA